MDGWMVKGALDTGSAFDIKAGGMARRGGF